MLCLIFPEIGLSSRQVIGEFNEWAGSSSKFFLYIWNTLFFFLSCLLFFIYVCVSVCVLVKEHLSFSIKHNAVKVVKAKRGVHSTYDGFSSCWRFSGIFTFCAHICILQNNWSEDEETLLWIFYIGSDSRFSNSSFLYFAFFMSALLSKDWIVFFSPPQDIPASEWKNMVKSQIKFCQNNQKAAFFHSAVYSVGPSDQDLKSNSFIL